ncbi:MAG: pyridoxamine 5'-phosphate oxidase family protein [Spirochaetota bacterium]|nr:MAG: pyridoxamine 5'-phosphate oxidase family protein [Spirochaetota bacterium]
MKTLGEVQQFLSNLFTDQKLAVLATQDKGQPYESVVAFVHTKDLRQLLFATIRTTRKFDYMSDNPKVSMLINNCRNEDEDFHRASAVTVIGEACEVEKSSDRINTYLDKLPLLEEFIMAPSCALIQVRVKSYIIVERFQTVSEVHVD